MHINLYGYYPTFAYKKILEDFPHIDSVTVGEPEFTALELAQHISQNRAPDEIHIPGLASRNNQGNVVFSPRPPVQDLDQLPYPDRQDIDLYKKKGIVTYIQEAVGVMGIVPFAT